MTSFFEKLKGSMSLEDEYEKEEEKPKEKKVKSPVRKQNKETVKKMKSSVPQKIKSSVPQKMESSVPHKIKVADESSPKSSDDEKRSPADQWFEDGELTVDVYQTADDIVLQSAVAGVKPENLDIAIENDMVTIKGERRNSVKEEKKNYIHQECFWGTFSRQILLPEEVDANRAEASFQEGVLTLRLPKINRQKVKKIKLS